MTQPFQASKFLIAGGPVNWYEPHAKAVAERNRQEDKAAAEFEAYTAKKLQVAKEESPLRKLAAFSTTIQAAAKLTSVVAKQAKANRQQEKLENQTKVADLFNRFNIGDEDQAIIADAYRNYKGPRNKIFTEANENFKVLNERFQGEEYKGFLDAIRAMGPKMQIQLQESASIRESIRISDPSAYVNSKAWEEKYKSGIEGALTPDDWLNKSDPQKQLEHKSWWHDQIASMGNSDELTRKYMGSELTRSASTKKNIDLANTSLRLSKQNIAIADGFRVTKAQSLDSAELPQLFLDEVQDIVLTEQLKDIEGGDTALQQAAVIARERFSKINRSGYIPPLAVQDFRDFKFQHPAGKDGYANLAEAFFKGDEGFFTEIVQDNKIGGQRYLAVQSSLDNRYAGELLEMGGTGKMTQDQFDVAVLNLKGRGNLSPQIITALERVNPTVQSQPIASDEAGRLDDLVSTGRTSNFDNEIAGFTQNSVIIAGKTKKQQLSKFRVDMGFDKTSSESGNNSDGWALGYVDTTLGLNLPPLSNLKAGTQSTAQRIISRIRDEEIGKQFKIALEAGTLNDTTHGSAVIVNVNRRLDELGINKIWGQPGAGPLSKHKHEKSFPGLEKYHEDLVEAGNESRIGSDGLVVEQEAVAIRDHIVKKGLDSALNERGLIVKNPEFLALSKSIDPSGRITNWPPDILLKAEITGVAPGVIAARQLEALLTSGDQGDKDYAIRHQLHKLTPILANYDQADAKWRQFLRDINDPSLPPGMHISRLTGNQFKRIMQYERDIDAVDTQERMDASKGTTASPELPANYGAQEDLQFKAAEWYREGKWDGLNKEDLIKLLKEEKLKLQTTE